MNHSWRIQIKSLHWFFFLLFLVFYLFYSLFFIQAGRGTEVGAFNSCSNTYRLIQILGKKRSYVNPSCSDPFSPLFMSSSSSPVYIFSTFTFFFNVLFFVPVVTPPSPFLVLHIERSGQRGNWDNASNIRPSKVKQEKGQRLRVVSWCCYAS